MPLTRPPRRPARHVLFIDVDSLIVHPNIDVLLEMVAKLEAAGKDMMLATENWRPSGDQLINTGVILARNTDWTRNFLSEIVTMRRNETCKWPFCCCFFVGCFWVFLFDEIVPRTQRL